MAEEGKGRGLEFLICTCCKILSKLPKLVQYFGRSITLFDGVQAAAISSFVIHEWWSLWIMCVGVVYQITETPLAPLHVEC